MSLPSWIEKFEHFERIQDVSLTSAAALQSDFERCVRQINSKADMQALWRKRKYSALEPSLRSRALFRHLLEHGLKNLLGGFLGDSELSSPVFENLDKIISEYLENGIDYKTVKLLTSLLQKALGVDIIPDCQVKLLLLNLRSLMGNVQDTSSYEESILHTYYQLWRGIIRGATNKGTKPSNEHCQILLDQVRDLPNCKLLVGFRCELLLNTSNSRYHLLGTESIPDLLALLAREFSESTRCEDEKSPRKALFDEFIGILNTLPKVEASQVVRSATERLMSTEQANDSAYASNQAYMDRYACIDSLVMNEWLTCIQHCTHFYDEKGLDDPIWKDLYWTIMSQAKPSKIGYFLRQNYADLDIAMIIFQNRFRSILTKRLQGSRTVSRAYQQAEQILHNEVSDALSSFPVLGVQPFVLISSALFACSLPRQRIEEEIVQFLFYTKGYLAVKRYVISMRKYGLFVHPHTLRNVITNLMSIDPESAVRISLLSEYLNLPHFPDLPAIAAGKGAVSPREAFTLLRRLYPGSQNDRSNETAMTQAEMISEKAAVLHKMATAFAHNYCLTAGRAFRAVYRCYRHLCTLKVAPGPAVAKALVFAGATRFLKRNQWVSTMKLRWILNIVRTSESKEAADRIDRIVWIWRGNVIERWQVKAAKRRKLRR